MDHNPLLLRRTDASNDGLLFKSESIAGLEDRKWEDPFGGEGAEGKDGAYLSSRRSSNGGFFHG